MIRHTKTALRTTASVFSVYAGLLGMEHGYFETLQGNVVPHGVRIRAGLSELPFPFGTTANFQVGATPPSTGTPVPTGTVTRDYRWFGVDPSSV